MRAFESIRKLLVTSDSSNCLKQKKNKNKKKWLSWLMSLQTLECFGSEHRVSSNVTRTWCPSVSWHRGRSSSFPLSQVHILSQESRKRTFSQYFPPKPLSRTSSAQIGSCVPPWANQHFWVQFTLVGQAWVTWPPSVEAGSGVCTFQLWSKSYRGWFPLDS